MSSGSLRNDPQLSAPSMYYTLNTSCRLLGLFTRGNHFFRGRNQKGSAGKPNQTESMPITPHPTYRYRAFHRYARCKRLITQLWWKVTLKNLLKQCFDTLTISTSTVGKDKAPRWVVRHFFRRSIWTAASEWSTWRSSSSLGRIRWFLYENV